MFNRFNLDYRKPANKGGEKREPVMNLAELARVTGKSRSVLELRLKKANPPLEVKLILKGKKYYSREEMLKLGSSIGVE
jgi:hypothetical protein